MYGGAIYLAMNKTTTGFANCASLTRVPQTSLAVTTCSHEPWWEGINGSGTIPQHLTTTLHTQLTAHSSSLYREGGKRGDRSSSVCDGQSLHRNPSSRHHTGQITIKRVV